MRNDRVKDNLLIDYNKNAVLSSATKSFCNFIVSNVASSIEIATKRITKNMW